MIVMRVEPRSGYPIMVQGYGEYRYHRRSGTRTRPMSASEVSEACAIAKRRDESLAERLSGLPLMARIYRRRSVDELRVATEGKVPDWQPLATVVVAAFDGPDPLIGTRRMSERSFPEKPDGKRGDARRSVLPEARWTLNPLGAEQRIVDSDDPSLVLHLVSVYRAGVIEWARRYSTPGMPSSSFADDAHNALLYAAGVFEEVGYTGRLATWVRIENADKTTLLLPHPWDKEIVSSSPESEFISGYREVSVDGLLTNPTPTIREAMDLIWQGFGVNSCLLFDQSGEWIK